MLKSWVKYFVRGLKVVVSCLLILLFVIQQYPFNLFSSPLQEQAKQCTINGNGCSCKGPVCMCMLYNHWKHQKHPLTNNQLCPCTNSHSSTLYSFSISRTLITPQKHLRSYFNFQIYPIQPFNSLQPAFESSLLKPPQLS